MRLLQLTPAELTRDPRARRAATAALARGLEVVGVCGRASGELPAALANVRVVRVGRPKELRERALAPRRDRALVRELRGLFRLGRLGVRTTRLRRGARALGRPDVVHAHDFDTLPAGWLVARSHGARLVYDAHELYSEFEPDPPRLYRRTTLALEAALARRADAVVTVSEPIAGELARRLRLPRRPGVTLNVPELDRTEPDGTVREGPLRAVYHGSFGTGRPPELLLEALRAARNVRLTLMVVRLDPDELSRLVAAAGLADRVEVVAPVPPDEVGAALRRFEVGIVFDRPQTLNGELSLPNKLFEYLMAGLAVVVPPLPALRPIVEEGDAGLVFEPGRLGEALERLAADRDGLARMRAQARRLAVERFNAEGQAEALARAWGV